MLPPDVRANSYSQPLHRRAALAPIAEEEPSRPEQLDRFQSVFDALVGQKLEEIEKGVIEATIASCNGSILERILLAMQSSICLAWANLGA